MKSKYFVWMGIVLATAPLRAAHSPLLPRPQSVVYGAGQLSVEGLEVRFASPPTAEDRFVARRISDGFAAILRHPVAIGTTAPSSKAILLIRDGDGAPLPQKDERPGPNSRESYGLSVTPNGAEIRARSSAGLYYGAETLLQLVEGDGASAVLPAVEIKDWPGLAYRGVMMDLSHGALPTVREIERQIDFLARFKANQYYFYSELTIELKGYPLVNPGARYSQDEVRQIIEYARERHVDVVPCLEFYGHLHDLFRLERYAGMAALPHSSEINPRNPQVLPMMRDWVEQMTALFPSPWFHIGLDEAWELERAAAARADGVDPTQRFIDHLKTVTQMAQQHGKRVLFWAETSEGSELFARHPDLVSQLPRGVVGVAWDYSVKKSYDATLGPLAKLGMPQVAASTVWGWEDIAPDFDRTFGNVDGLLGDGHKYNIIGVLHTNWADDGQVFYRATWPGMAYGAAASWQSVPMDRANFFSDYAARAYPPAAAPEVAAGLKALAHAQTDVMRAIGDHSAFRIWDDPLYPPRLERLQRRVDVLRKTRLEAEEAQEHLQRALSLDAGAGTIIPLLIDAKLIDYAGMKFLYAVELADRFQKLPTHPTRDDIAFWLFTQASSYDHSPFMDLMDTIKGLEAEYRSAWLAEYGPYRLGTALGRFDAEYEYWRRLQANFWDFQSSFRNNDPVPPLETFRPWGLKRP